MLTNNTAEIDDPVADYLKTNYPQHYKKITRARGNAWFVRFFYPTMGVFFTLVPFGGAALLVNIVASVYSEKINNLLTPETLSLIINVLNILALVCSAFGLLIGLSSGLGKASDILFAAEKTEIKARTEYYLRFLVGMVDSDKTPLAQVKKTKSAPAPKVITEIDDIDPRD